MQSSTGQPYSFQRWPPKLGPFFCLFGALWVVCSLWILWREISLEGRARLVDGEVVGFQQRTDPHMGLVVAPIFRISVDGSRTVDVPSFLASRPSQWTIGEHAKVFYDPGRPTQIVADTWFDRWGLQSVFFLAGVFFFAVGVFGIRTRRNNANSPIKSPMA
jgi:hypothetical protein